MASIEVKIKKLDGELARYKEQMSKLRNGPGKVRCALCATACARADPCSAECDTRARVADAEAEADVREPDRAVDTADVQHGICGTRDGEPPEHDGDGRCDEASE